MFAIQVLQLFIYWFLVSCACIKFHWRIRLIIFFSRMSVLHKAV